MKTIITKLEKVFNLKDKRLTINYLYHKQDNLTDANLSKSEFMLKQYNNHLNIYKN